MSPRTVRLRLVLGAALLTSLAAPAVVHASLITPSSTATQLANAMSAQPGLVTGASWPSLGGAANPSAAYANGFATGFVGKYMPDDGPSFAAMTNGDVGLADPPNDSTAVYTNNGNSYGGANDVSVLRVNLNVPAGANCLSFDGVFYSEEYPEFVGIAWNDGFIAELDKTTWSYSDAARDVTAPDNFAFDENGHLLEVNTVHFTGESTGLQYDGSSKLFNAATPVTPGAHSLYLSIYDAGDHNVDTAVFLDNLRSAHTSNCAPGAVDLDSDGDGLSDAWESGGADTNSDGTVDVDLPAMGADPKHKDVFVQLDAMPNLRLSNDALALVTDAFAKAPVTNPDGKTGVRLHVDNGSGSVMNPVTGAKWGSLSQAKSIPYQKTLGDEKSTTWWSSYFDPLKGAAFAVRAPVFHFAASINRFNKAGNSGWSRGLGASDFFVALGLLCNPEGSCPGPVKAQAGTFMHELGHNLGLHHGGLLDTNYVPNYLSVMNYLFQFAGSQKNSFPLTGAYNSIDYSRYGGNDFGRTLSESALDEHAGFDLKAGSALGNDTYTTAIWCPYKVGPITTAHYWQALNLTGSQDFNCNGKIDDGTVSNDLNSEDGSTDVLAAFEDWSRLQYKGGAVGGNGLTVLLPDDVPLDEPTADQLQAVADSFVAPPEPSTAGTTGVTEQAATLHGTVDAHGDASTKAYFQYGTTTDYGQRTDAQPVAAIGPAAVASTVSALSPETTYHYQLVSESDTHLVFGADGTFTTGAAAQQPAPGPAAPVQPPGPSGPVVAPRRALAQARLGKVTLSKSGVLRVKVTCAAKRQPCNGRVSATRGQGRTAVTVATATVKLAAGSSLTLKLKPTKAGRRVLRAQKVKLRVKVALLAGGSGQARNVTARRG